MRFIIQSISWFVCRFCGKRFDRQADCARHEANCFYKDRK